MIRQNTILAMLSSRRVGALAGTIGGARVITTVQQLLDELLALRR